MPDFRRKLWLNILEDLGPPEGCILPAYLICVSVVLFPLHGLRTLLYRDNGFDFFRGVWRIHGIEYSNQFFLRFAVAQGETYRFTTINGVVTVERLSVEQADG
jgi:hypothetical protein